MKTKYIFLSTLVLVAVASAWASEPNELERLRAEKTQLKRDCEAMRKANIKLREENQQLKEENKKLTTQLKTLQPSKQKAEVAKLFVHPLSVGQIGKIDIYLDAEVRKIIDANSAWVNLTTQYYNPRLPISGRYGTGDPMPNTSEVQLVFVRGIDTSTMADGLKLNLPGLFKITKTEKRGERTAFLLEPYNDK